MSDIVESNDVMSNDIDFSQLLDLPEATFVDLGETAGAVSAADEAALLALDA